MEDNETKNILSEQRLINEVLNHQGWPVIRTILANKILALQNAFDIDHATPTTMFRDLQARKKATEILFDFLREVEGAKEVAQENPKEKSHIINLEKDN